MLRASIPVAAWLLVASPACLAAEPSSTSFDGRWWIELVCADAQDRNGPVKGYTYAFAATIVDGRLEAQYGTRGAPASVTFDGTVANDGTLEIRAVGNTGRSDYSVGQVAQGSAYRYTMRGTFDGARGQAVRREVRPCTATFAKQ